MIMRLLPGLVLALALADPAAAQLAVEARAGASIGNHRPAAAGLETHPGLAASLALEYAVRPTLSAYAAYTRAAFGCAEGFCADRDVTFVGSGFGLGVRFHPPRRPWLRGGLTWFGVRAEVDGEDSTVDPELGYELAAGYAFPLSPRIDLLPGLLYRAHFAAEQRTTVLGADLGLRMRIR